MFNSRISGPHLREASPAFSVLLMSLLLLSPFIGRELRADTENDTGTWISSLTNITLDESWRAALFFEPRISFDDPQPRTDGEVRQFFTFGAIGYALDSNFTIFQGYGVLPSYSPTRVEHRLFQDIVGRHMDEKWRFMERFRLEERLLEGVSGTSLRGRFLLRAQHPLPVLESISGVVSQELFLNFNEPADNSPEPGFDQNRFFVGVNTPLSEHLSLETGYMNLFLERPGPRSNISNHLFVLSLISNLDLS